MVIKKGGRWGCIMKINPYIAMLFLAMVSILIGAQNNPDTCGGATPPVNYGEICNATNSCGLAGFGTIQCDGSCNATMPLVPANYGNACTKSNACGQWDQGTIQCNGTCSAIIPQLPLGYGQPCTMSNLCGQKNYGTLRCNGTCSVTAPALPSYYGLPCNSSSNICGYNSGSILCNGACSASAPIVPVNYGQECNATNVCGEYNTGTILCSGSCSAVKPVALDSDGDTIANCIDNCPTIANTNQLDSDNDGTGNACDSYICVPTGAEICDGIDNDCNGAIDEDLMNTYFPDSDADGFGSALTLASCTQPEGYVANNADCNDTDAAVNPNGIEVAYDGIDQNCDGTDLIDTDGDGYNSTIVNGTDCNDTDFNIHPGATDIAGDGIDQNCDSIDSVVASGGGGGGGGGKKCTPEWECKEWTSCNESNTRRCLGWIDSKLCRKPYTGKNTESCTYSLPEPITKKIEKKVMDSGNMSKPVINQTDLANATPSTNITNNAPPFSEENVEDNSEVPLWLWSILGLAILVMIALLMLRKRD
jgi:hypothetical protein